MGAADRSNNCGLCLVEAATWRWLADVPKSHPGARLRWVIRQEILVCDICLRAVHNQDFPGLLERVIAGCEQVDFSMPALYDSDLKVSITWGQVGTEEVLKVRSAVSALQILNAFLQVRIGEPHRLITEL